jgi:2,3-bisphosphoglycerate-dependent phosphoglycerate mutase
MTKEAQDVSILEDEDKAQSFTVVFVRHAEAVGPAINETVGPQLTSMGKMQAERLADRLAKDKFSHIYTSDLSRAYNTAQEVIKRHKETPYTVTADIREITYYHFTPDAQLVRPALRKIIRAEREALERFSNHLRRAHNPGETILVVCHGNFIRTVIPVLGGRDPRKSVLIEFNNTSVSILDVWQNGQAVLKLANCVKHLLPGQIT